MTARTFIMENRIQRMEQSHDLCNKGKKFMPCTVCKAEGFVKLINLIFMDKRDHYPAASLRISLK